MPTPSLYAKGVYTVEAPFAVEPDVSYSCIAIRSFTDLRQQGLDVFSTFYNPKGITQSKYQQDDLAAASIITLFAEDKPVLNIPSTYILTYPTTVTTGFSRVMMGIEIGIVPDAMNLDLMKTELAEVVQRTTGLQATVELFVAPYTGVVTAEQAESFEANRQAAIEENTSVYKQLADLQAENIRLSEVNAEYERIILSNDLVP